MTHVCSVILIRRSFDIYHEQQKISLHNESILLLEKNLADDFAFCSPDTRRPLLTKYSSATTQFRVT